jgi:hypothetical protein
MQPIIAVSISIVDVIFRLPDDSDDDSLLRTEFRFLRRPVNSLFIVSNELPLHLVHK